MKKGRSAAQKIDFGWRKLGGNNQNKNSIRIIREGTFSQEENTEWEKVPEEFQHSPTFKWCSVGVGSAVKWKGAVREAEGKAWVGGEGDSEKAKEEDDHEGGINSGKCDQEDK